MNRSIAAAFAFLLATFLSPHLQAEPAPAMKPEKLPKKENFHLYLLMGQSNMAGRGAVEVEDKTPHPRVLNFNYSNVWEVAVEPITRKEKGKSPGVGPGLAFAKAMAEKNPDVVIGLVPTAVGGTPLRRWEHGADLYSNAVARARLAMKDGTLKGFLWHQGEADSKEESDAKSYGDRLAKMISAIRNDLGVSNAPFVVGQIGEFLYARNPNPGPYAQVVNETLRDLPKKVPATGCALSKGLNHKGDQLHFNSESQREFGRRYAAEMMRLQSAAPASK